MSDLDDRYRDEGWGVVAERALNISPSDTESQAREVARWAWAEIERLKSALGGAEEALADLPTDQSCVGVRMAQKIIEDVIARD